MNTFWNFLDHCEWAVDKFILMPICNMMVWAGDEIYRWQMRSLGWDNWSTKSAPVDEPEESSVV